MTVEPFNADHLGAMTLQPHQAYLHEFITDDYLQVLLAGEVARTIRVDGRIVACFGVATVPAIGRMLWCFFADIARNHLVRLHRFARDFTTEHAHPFLHATVEQGFAPGERMMRLLGFTFVDVIEHYGPDARNHLLFVEHLCGSGSDNAHGRPQKVIRATDRETRLSALPPLETTRA